MGGGREGGSSRNGGSSPPAPHPAGLDEQALLRDCDVRTGRVSGPGGQHRNKVETAVEIRHRSTGAHGRATERRSQQENRHKAIFRLRVNLAIDVRRPFDFLAGPSELWRSRLHAPRRTAPPGDPVLRMIQRKTTPKAQIAVNPSHHDFPTILAEALDVLAGTGYDPKKAALVLEISTSQLIKLLKLEPRALSVVNQQRALRRQRLLM